jgi:hypothetical protein
MKLSSQRRTELSASRASPEPGASVGSPLGGINEVFDAWI